MAKLDDSLRVLHYADGEIPSPQEFSVAVEPRNVPAVFRGAVKNWEAISRWDPVNGGLDYLEERVGSANVDAMLSRSAPVFYGDVRSHERVTLPLSDFISSCKLHLRSGVTESCLSDERKDCLVSQVNSEESCSTSLDRSESDQIYLAQVPILSTEGKEKSQLEDLFADIQTPGFVRTKELTSINFWMNKAQSRSSTHYDPYHNLLCVVSGSKQVVLWPPPACSVLYPMPIHGESSNHSAVDLENPDLSLHARAKHSGEYSQEVSLRSGDALFIPEGWFHQVDSNDMTIAVNFWWKSHVMTSMSEHMDAYYLRRILNRLVGKEMNLMLQNSSVSNPEGRETCKNINEALKGCHAFDSNCQIGNINGNSKKNLPVVQQLRPLTVNMLYELISLVHDAVKVDGQHKNEVVGCKKTEGTSPTDPRANPRGQQSAIENPPPDITDPIADSLCLAEPLMLKEVLQAMACQFPRTLEAFVLHVLSPRGAEVLTRKFDEMDQKMTKEQQAEFYQLFYSVFDDPNTTMDAILRGKEAFAFQAVQNVVGQYLGLCVDKPK